MKIACLLAPNLPIQVEWSRDPSLTHRPLVVGGRPWDDGAVVDCCPQAAAAGVSPGMRLSEAERRCPTAHFVSAHEDLYHASHDTLISAAKQRTPAIETAGLGLLYVEVAGLERRFGPDPQLAQEIAQQACQASGLSVQVGIASGKFVAEQAARAARPGAGCVVPPGDEHAFLSSLLLSSLPADAEMCRRLNLLGVRTLGALAALPRLAVVRQFGPHAGPLHDLACGVDPRPVRPDAPPLVARRSHTFDDPLTDRAPLLAHVDQMAATLARDLSHSGHQAEGIRLHLEEEGGEKHAIGAPVKPPSADSKKLSRLAGRLLGELVPAGPVAALSLSIYPLRPFHLSATQLALWTGPSDARQSRLREALRRLRERFGEMIVVVASLVGPPPPCPIQLTTDSQGLPRALIWRENIQEVAVVYEIWRERRRWWSLPIQRDYYRLELDDGLVRTVFHDLRSGRWLLERRYV